MVLEVQITSSLRVVCEDGPVPLPSSSRQSRSSRQHNADEFQEPSSDEMSRSSSISLWSSEGDKLRSRDSDTPDTSFFEDITPGQPHEIVVHPKSADQPSRPSRFLLAWPFIVTWTYVLLSPHTKVEETPGLHAVHDILAFGISPKALLQYDHILYPGPVPRSFVPSLVLAGFTQPFLQLGTRVGLITSPFHVQILIRLILATCFSLAFGHLTTTLHKVYSRKTAIWYVWLSMTAFHIPYYAGRTLPNFMALPLVLMAFPYVLGSTVDFSSEARQGSCAFGLGLLTFTATLIRFELAPLALSLALVLVCRRRLSCRNTLQAGAIGGFSAVLLSSSIDLYFQSPTNHVIKWWPELSSFIFNIAEGRASEWGVMSRWYYLMTLPRILLFSGPLLLFGVSVAIWSRVSQIPITAETYRERSHLSWYETPPKATRRVELPTERVMSQIDMEIILVPVVVSIFAMSCVGHKEWRFITYASPLLTVVAARGADWLWSASEGPVLRPLIRLALIGGLTANLAMAAVMCHISRMNYPGGQIGSTLAELSISNGSQKVWIPAAALHTGATFFTFPSTHAMSSMDSVSDAGESMIIDHPESAYRRCFQPFGNSPDELWNAGYDFVVTDNWEAFVDGWELTAEVDGYKGVELLPRLPGLRINKGRRLAVMRRVIDAESLS